jgi:hypothetical protein
LSVLIILSEERNWLPRSTCAKFAALGFVLMPFVFFLPEHLNSNNSASGAIESSGEENDDMSASENSSDSNDSSSENEQLSSDDDDSEMDCDDIEPYNSNDSKSSTGAEKISKKRKKKALTAERLAKIHQEEVCR